MTAPWFSHHDNLITLGRVLVDEGMTAEELLYFFEKPWKWEEKWEELADRGEVE